MLLEVENWKFVVESYGPSNQGDSPRLKVYLKGRSFEMTLLRFHPICLIEVSDAACVQVQTHHHHHFFAGGFFSFWDVGVFCYRVDV